MAPDMSARIVAVQIQHLPISNKNFQTIALITSMKPRKENI